MDPGEWYLPEGFLNQSLEHESDNDLTIGGASIDESAHETYRDRLLAGLGFSASDSILSKQEQTDILRALPETRQDILNLLGTKYGFHMDEEEDEVEEEEEVTLQELKDEFLSNYPRKPQQTKQIIMNQFALSDGSALNEIPEENSGLDREESCTKKRLQARQNTINHSEFKEDTDLLEEDNCSTLGFLEELQEGLRRRGMKWQLSTEESINHSNNEYSPNETLDNIVDTPLESTVGNSSTLSNDCGGDGGCNTADLIQSLIPIVTAGKGDSVMYMYFDTCLSVLVYSSSFLSYFLAVKYVVFLN